MPIQFLYRYQVNGMGSFPTDMLRYDSAWPSQESDSGIIEARQHHERDASRMPVNITGLNPPTVARWESFMWQVVGPGREGTPMRFLPGDEDTLRWLDRVFDHAVKLYGREALTRTELHESAASVYDPPEADSPSRIAALLLSVFQDLAQEHFRVVSVGTKHGVIGNDLLYKGTIDSATIRPAEVFGCAIRRNAKNVIVAHNHPSGDPTPSPEDLETTRRLIECGKLLGILVLDHIVFGAGRWVSIRQHFGMLKFER